MKQDLDRLMAEQNIDALLITGPAQHNPFMYYMTGGVHITQGDLVKKRGEKGTLFYNPMEREEAAHTGLDTKSMNDYSMKELLKETGGDLINARARRYQLMLQDLEITSGKIALYGKADLGEGYATFRELQKLMPDIELFGEASDSLLLKAMATKDADEIQRMREMGKITTTVVGRVAEYLQSQNVTNEVLVNELGVPITVGDVKGKINLWLAELGAENPEGTIFAIGHDAGVPHSTGTASDVMRLGQTIVFDIFPCEAGGGYYYDFTRTWSLGYATDEAQSLYDDVYQVYQQIMAELKVDTQCQQYQDRTCELFEERGHPTVKSDPKTLNGYVHSVGHGLGLHVHERPWFGRGASEDDVMARGVVVTIEPGLYYPDENMGCRLEDTVYVTPEGEMEILADYPLDLVLPIKGK